MIPNIVLDTNVLLVSISPRSQYRWIFDALVNEQFTLCVTTEILFEYEEIITKHMDKKVADTVLQIIENAINVQMITSYYKWRLISADPDDNKFTDCAVSASAHFIVTEDKHFNIIKTIEFPKINVIGIDEFYDVLSEF